MLRVERDESMDGTISQFEAWTEPLVLYRKHNNAEGKGHVSAMIRRILGGQIGMIALMSHNQAIDLVCTPGRGLPDLHLDPTLVSQNHPRAI